MIGTLEPFICGVFFMCGLIFSMIYKLYLGCDSHTNTNRNSYNV